jgi:RecA-family ATPase
MNLLPYLPAAELGSCPEERRWLIENLWADQAVGVVGGEPKCCKSFLALDMAVAVAGGSPCLRRYPVPHPGRVLLFAAEDALHVVRQRIVGICTVVGRRIEDLDLQVITAPALRLDLEADRQRLDRTVAALRPKLLVLDPFVRLHRIDENASGDVAPLLAFLRTLQRTYELAVVIVHHARKGAATQRAGQALRGSSEFHAWGDSNLYLRRTEEHIQLTIEHRAAPSPNEPVNLTLCAEGERLALQLAGAVTPAAAAVDAETLETRITQILADADRPLPIAELRGRCKVRMATLCTAMANLTEQRRVVRSATGYAAVSCATP